MKHQKNVIAWTLFELVILLAFFVYPSFVSRHESTQKEVQALHSTLSRASQKIQTLEEESGELKTKLMNLSKKDQLKSKQLPSCIEKGLVSDFLFHVKIIGKDKYHIESFIDLLQKIGYVGTPINEAYAIVHSEGEDFGYSCMTISWGAGLTNVGMANELWEIDSFKFSISRGGDYIDTGVSDSLRIPVTRVILEKEGDRKKEIPRLDLTNPRNEIQVALKYFYKSYINYVLDLIHSKFFTLKTTVPLPDSIPIICSGGSALPKGFIDLVKEGVLSKRSRLPFTVSDVILAKSPLTAVAKGLRAKLEMDNV